MGDWTGTLGGAWGVLSHGPVVDSLSWFSLCVCVFRCESSLDMTWRQSKKSWQTCSLVPPTVYYKVLNHCSNFEL